MSKILDWNTVADVNFDDKRRKATGSVTGRELFAKAYERLEAQKAHAEWRAQVEPVLKAHLIAHMSSKTPIKIIKSFQNPTEVAGNTAVNEEDDGFYSNISKSSGQEIVKFQEVMETIPAGIELVYKSWDKPMGQWIFKGSNGKEYAIYDKSVIIYKDSAMENPGLYGLLYNTNLSDKLGD